MRRFAVRAYRAGHLVVFMFLVDLSVSSRR